MTHLVGLLLLRVLLGEEVEADDDDNPPASFSVSFPISASLLLLLLHLGLILEKMGIGSLARLSLSSSTVGEAQMEDLGCRG